MVKSTNIKDNINSLGKGILEDLGDSAKDVQEQNINNSNKEISNSDEVVNNNNVIKDNANTVNDEKSNNITKSKRVKKEKSESKEKNKRSFMLNDTAVQQLKMLNLALDDKDLGEIVIDAIDLLYKKNEKKVESYITDMFNSLKK